VLDENSVEHFRSEGYVKIKHKNIISQVNNLVSYLREVTISVAQEIGMNLTDKSSEIIEEDDLHQLLIDIHKLNPKAFAFIYDVMNRSSAIYHLMLADSLIDMISKLFPSSINEKCLVAMNNFQFLMQRHGDEANINGVHQDSGYFSEYGSIDSSIVVWIPITDVYFGAGTIEVIPASHKRGPLKHSQNSIKLRKSLVTDRSERGGIFVPKSEYKEGDLIPIDCMKGEAAIMHYDLLHRTGLNHSQKIRMTALARLSNVFGKNYINKYGIW